MREYPLQNAGTDRNKKNPTIVASSLSILNFQNAFSPLGYMVGQNISGQGTCHRDNTDV